MLALFRYIQLLARRGSHRTALEFCKALYAVQPEDPLGVLLIMDYHALKANCLDVVFSLAKDRIQSGALLPNLAFSLALARFLQESSV